MPQRVVGARPPMTTSGEPANRAWAIALTPFVTPGPAVSTARPGTRVSFPVASAAKTAVASCRTSRIRIGGVGPDRGVVHREDMGTRQREQRLDPVLLGDGDGEVTAVALEVRVCSPRRPGRFRLGHDTDADGEYSQRLDLGSTLTSASSRSARVRGAAANPRLELLGEIPMDRCA